MNIVPQREFYVPQVQGDFSFDEQVVVRQACLESGRVKLLLPMQTFVDVCMKMAVDSNRIGSKCVLVYF